MKGVSVCESVVVVVGGGKGERGDDSQWENYEEEADIEMENFSFLFFYG